MYRVCEGSPTPRQLELLVLYSGGHGRREIAAMVSLSIRTIDAHFRVVRQRLGARSLAHAILICVARGYLRVDSRDEVAFVPDALDSELDSELDRDQAAA